MKLLLYYLQYKEGENYIEKKVMMKNGYPKELKHFKKEKNLQMFGKKVE